MRVDKQDVLKRIHYIEGHLGGIGRMIEEDATCIDVLRQTYAVRRAIERLEVLLVENPLAPGVHQAIANGDEEALLTEVARFYPPGGKRLIAGNGILDALCPWPCERSLSHRIVSMLWHEHEWAFYVVA